MEMRLASESDDLEQPGSVNAGFFKLKPFWLLSIEAGREAYSFISLASRPKESCLCSQCILRGLISILLINLACLGSLLVIGCWTYRVGALI